MLTGEYVVSGGSLGADRSANSMAYESHTLSTAVQCSREELLRNVTAVRDGTAQTSAAAAAAPPLCRPAPRNDRLLLEYKLLI